MAPAMITVVFLLPFLLPWVGARGDIFLYFSYADAIFQGQTPYVQVPIEYPPVAAALFLLPRLFFTSATAYSTAFIVLMGCVDAAQKALLWQAVPPRVRLHVLLTATASAALLYATYLKRFDVVPAALTTLACVLAARRPGSRSAWFFLGLAIATKVYALVLLPVFAGHAWRASVSRALHAAQWLLLAFPLALVTLASYRAWGDASLTWWHFHAGRGLHLASSYSAVAMLLQGLGTPTPFTGQFGAWQIDAPWADACARAAPWLTLMLLALTYRRFWPTLGSADGLWCAAAASLVALFLGSKTFSPQYVILLVPLASAACVQNNRFHGWRAALLVATCLLTGGTFPNEFKLAQGVLWKQVCLLGRFGTLAALGLLLARAPKTLHSAYIPPV